MVGCLIVPHRGMSGHWLGGSRLKHFAGAVSPPVPRRRPCKLLYERAVPRSGATRADGWVLATLACAPPPKAAGRWDELLGGRYTVTEVTTALADLARGVTYTEAARRVQVNHVWDPTEGTPEPSMVDGRRVAYRLDRFASPSTSVYSETDWPQTLVLDSTEFVDANARKRGRVWGTGSVPVRSRAGMATVDAPPSRPPGAGRVRQRQGNSLSCPPQVAESAPPPARAPPVRQRQTHLPEDGQEGWGNIDRMLLAAPGSHRKGGQRFGTRCWRPRSWPRRATGCGTGTGS